VCEWRRFATTVFVVMVIILFVVLGILLKVPEREFFIDSLLVRIHFIIVMIRWTGLAPWDFEFPFLGSLTSTFLQASVTLPYAIAIGGALVVAASYFAKVHPKPGSQTPGSGSTV